MSSAFCRSASSRLAIVLTRIREPSCGTAGGLRAAKWHYMNYGEKGEEFYDMIKDFHEYTNLVENSEYTEIIENARTKYRQRMANA